MQPFILQSLHPLIKQFHFLHFLSQQSKHRTMVSGSFTRENVSTVSVDRIWKGGVLDVHNLLPKIMPEFISNIEHVEGDGGVGTVKKTNFTEAVKEFRFLTDKIEVLDHEKYIIKQVVIEGGLTGQRLKSYSFERKFDVVSGGGTLGKTTVEYETADDTPLSAEEQEEIISGIILMIKGVEEYLLANPTAYA